MAARRQSGASSGVSRRVCVTLLLVFVTALEASSRNGRRERERLPVQVFLLGGEPVECTRIVASAGACRLLAHAHRTRRRMRVKVFMNSG